MSDRTFQDVQMFKEIEEVDEKGKKHLIQMKNLCMILSFLSFVNLKNYWREPLSSVYVKRPTLNRPRVQILAVETTHFCAKIVLLF